MKLSRRQQLIIGMAIDLFVIISGTAMAVVMVLHIFFRVVQVSHSLCQRNCGRRAAPGQRLCERCRERTEFKDQRTAGSGKERSLALGVAEIG